MVKRKRRTLRRVAPAPAAVSRFRAPVGAAQETPLTIAGVGASAGGLEAFSALLYGLPADPAIAIVFVQHLSRQHESALVTLLSSQSALPVVQATHGAVVEPNHVYVIPPNTQMVIRDRTLHLSVRPDDRSQYTPIDTFLSSLAEAVGSRAIGVILSGTASDGALGIRDIKTAGGVTIAQEPASAKYDGMPQAAIATGTIDLVLTAKDIGAKLAQLARHPDAGRLQTGGTDPLLKDDQLQRVFDILRPVSGIDFRHYKLPTIRRRLFRRMALHRLDDVSQYVELLRTDPAEVRNLYDDLLIHVTRFFREPESFDALTRQVLPPIVQGRGANQPVRAWVSGCATGEEAYSLAIAIVEYQQNHYLDIPIQIFATDVSDSAIEHARAGIFAASITADVSPQRLRRFFTKHDGGYRIVKMVRDMCVFARQDLTRDPPFSRLDVILCRNVLIYMDAVLQKKLLSVFHYALNPNGFLVLGQAETVGASLSLFSVVDKKFRIHRKKAMTDAPTMMVPIDYAGSRLPARRSHLDIPGTEKFLQAEVSRIVMDRFAPPGVVVDNEMQILQFRGQTGAYLEPAPGDASLNLLKMAKEGLLYGLRSALQKARKSKLSVRKDGLQVRTGDGWRPVSLEVIPLAGTARPHYLVLFDGTRSAAGRRPAAAPAPPQRLATTQRKTQLDLLRRELAASREYLQSIIQELEAANEELQSANEEILSSNEELQSTNEELDTAKEELQSTNEELNTVNEELHRRNEELSRVNSDLINLLSSVQIAIVIVSAELRIRRFTPMAEKVLNLIPADTDRLIGHINPTIVGANLEELITDCIDTIAPVEREVQDRQGRWYSLRIRPYRSLDNKIDGAVVSLYDIDVPKRYGQSIQAAVSLVEEMVAVAPQRLALVDAELRLCAASASFASALAISDRKRGQSLAVFVQATDEYEKLRALFDRDTGTAIDGFSVVLRPTQQTSAVAVEAKEFLHGPFGRMVLLKASDAPVPE